MVIKATIHIFFMLLLYLKVMVTIANKDFMETNEEKAFSFSFIQMERL